MVDNQAWDPASQAPPNPSKDHENHHQPKAHADETREYAAVSGSATAVSSPSHESASQIQSRSHTSRKRRKYERKARSQLPTRNGVEVVREQAKTIAGVEGSLKPRHVSSGAFDSRKVYQNFTDMEVFNGNVRPDDICGTLVSDLATRYSNTFIAENVNKLYEKLNLKPITKNTLGKRITFNIKYAQGLNGQAPAGTYPKYQQGRNALNVVRGTASIRYHNGFGDQNKTGQPQGP